MAMASWQAHALSFFLRLRFKRQLAAAQDVAQVRRVMNQMPAGQPRGVHCSPWVGGGIQGERVVMPDSQARPPLLYLHGGGFVAGSPLTHRAITVAFARRGFEVFVPDYRLAPEHPFPAALDDALAAYQDVLAMRPGQAPVIAGDSAGGGLALSLMLNLKAMGLPLPQGAVLFSPWLDLTLSGASLAGNAHRCAMFGPDQLQKGVDLYLQGRAANAPLASPLWGDLQGLPPILTFVGLDEVLRDDARRLHERALGAGVAHHLQEWPVVPHVWPLFRKWLPEGRGALAMAADFLHTPAHPVVPLQEIA
jgi:acetyl esterase/lipase